MEPTQGEINPSSYHHQMDGVAQYQTLSPSPPPLEQQPYFPQPLWDMTCADADGEQPVHRWMEVGTAGCMSDSSNVKPEAMDVPEMFGYVDFDGNAGQYDRFS